ncbi:hypothetical protein RA210_U10729 [Rubrivivax sp. A210]|uniref:DUF4212 domain-containing protein n=1 Tax=Rubrivivax sp. A210 TaxID=2772301 RepID=UPI00191B00E6|nr:sodium/substrate symporter small subunit [Rubrivivax sp. A210]CAD5367256.1 hypothetical protein RA210_U10729 [Rubrivivax sp. A210]
MLEARQQGLWRSTRKLTGLLLLVWLLANLLGPWFAHAMTGWRVAGVPLGYWLAAQGLLGLYLALIVVYIVVMNRLERRCRDAGAPEADPRGTE